MANLAYGTLTITNLSIVTSVDVYYYNSTSPTNLLGDEWSTDTPTWTDGKYVWSKTVTTWEQNVTTQSEPVCITGQKGSTGAAGQSVTRITQQYALSSDPDNAPITGWSTTMQPFETGKYYWTRSEIVWANPTNTTYTTAVLANGITSANTTAATANSNASAAVSTANSANTKADSAVETANTANQTAQNAVSVANGKNTIYYSSSKPTGGTYKAGDTWFFLTDDGYKLFEYDTTSSDWVQKSMDGKAITAGTITAAQIHSGAITTDKIYSNAITTNKLATDAIKSSNYVAGTAPYSGAGTFLNLSNGNIYSPNFGINNDSTDNITDGAYIKGSIYAYNGTIGSNTEVTAQNPYPNYWYIGDYWDYNQNTSAYIKGNGTATIQLGSLNTWRLNTNRIHTAWNDDSQEGDYGKLHYPVYNLKYWDMGLHVPSSTTDKFIYIRNSKNSSSIASLTNLQNSIDDQANGTNNDWNYQFYVTSEGNLYAKNIYVLDQYNNPIQIGGSGGIAGVLPVYSGGTGSTSFTSKGIIYASGTNPQTLLSTAVGTSGQLLSSGSDGTPSWVNASSLSVSHATTATQDGSGNTITNTYMPFDGGTFTGNVIFNNDIKAPSLNNGQVIYSVIGTQTATTASWTGNLPIEELYDGLTIAYYLPRTSASNATLSLTLADGTSTYAIPIYVTGTTRVGTHYGAGSTVLLTYWSAGSIEINGTVTTEDRWTGGDYWNSNTIGEYAGSAIAGPNGMARYSLILQVDNTHWESLVLTSSDAATKTKNDSGFLLTSPIYYQSAGTYSSGKTAGQSGVWSTYSGINSRYSFNVSNSWSATGRSLYLVGSIVNNKFYLKNTTWWADALPTEADGYYYWYVGQMYSAYQFTLAPVHPIWYYKDGQLKQLFVQNLTNSQIIDGLGYTPYNATNPNGYTTNTGTVTQVTAGTGLKINNNTSGGNITNTGTINHINSVTAQNTQALYPIKIDAQGHISAYGTAITSLPASDVSAWAKANSKPSYSYSEISGTPNSLKNPNDLEIKVYNGSATSSDILYDGSTSNQSVSVAGTNAITGITSTQDGKLQLTLADGTQPNPIQVKITATTSDSAASADKLNLSSDVGSSTQPVYFDANTGLPIAIGYTIQSNVPANAIFPKFEGTYNESTNKAATVSTVTNAVTNAINALDGGTIGTGNTGKTITALSQTDGQVSATFNDISISKSQVSDFSHSHGNILNAGTITSTAVALGNGDSLLFADSSNSGKIEKSSITIGTGTTKYLRQDGTWGTPGGTYSLPLAANGTRGGVQIGYSSSGKNYAVQLNNEKMYVNVPWTDTTYEAATTNPLMDGTAAVGTSERYARQDHKHPSDTSRVPTTRTVNGHALSADITISKSDIGLGNVENTALSTALQDYVTLATTQTISGRKTFNDLASTVFKGSTGSEYCNINYDQTLSALVFSFG